MFQFECCGVDSWTDWQKYNDYFQYNANSEKIPESCCDPSYDEVRFPTLEFNF